MIKLTKRTREEFYLNPQLIERVEETPDTVISLTNDKKIVVKETAEEIKERIIAFYRRIYTPAFFEQE